MNPQFIQPVGTSGQNPNLGFAPTPTGMATPQAKFSSNLDLNPLPVPTTTQTKAIVTAKPAQDYLSGIKSNADAIYAKMTPAQLAQTPLGADQLSKYDPSGQALALRSGTTAPAKTDTTDLTKATGALTGTTPTAMTGQDFINQFQRAPTQDEISSFNITSPIDTLGKPISTPTTTPVSDVNAKIGNAIVSNESVDPSVLAQSTGLDAPTVNAYLNSPEGLAAERQYYDNQSAKTFSQFYNQLNQIQNGTFPLSSSQQALLSSTQQMFDQAKNAQLIANQNYQNAVQQLNIQSGRSQYAPINAMGTLQAAVNTGVQKIADIENKAAQELAKLQQGFMSDNYKMVSDSYSALSKFLTDKTSEIQKLQDAAQKAQQDQKDYNLKLTQAQLDSDKFTYQQKQDAIDNAFKKQQLDETQKKDAEDYLIKKATLDAQNQANQILQNAMNAAPGVGGSVTLPNGSPDPAAQDKFLSTLPPDVATLVKGISDYSINPSSIPTRQFKGAAGLTQQQILALVKIYEKSYDSKEYGARQKFLTNWKAGGQNSVIVSANTAVQHLNELQKDSESLGNIRFPVIGSNINSTRQWLNETSGNPQITRFKTDSIALAGELAKIYKNSINSSQAPSDTEILQELGNMSTGMSSDQINAFVENSVKLMTDRLVSARENYNANMGKDPTPILTQSAKKAIQDLQNKGLNVDMSALDPSPYSGMSGSDFLNSVNKQSTSAMSNNDFFNMAATNVQNAASLNQ